MLIGLVKGCVHRVLCRNPLSYEMFLILLTEVETTLNRRPLTRASSDVDDLDPLTPSDLLHGRRLHTIPLELDDDGDATYGPDTLSCVDTINFSATCWATFGKLTMLPIF